MNELFDLLRADIYTDAWEYRDRVERVAVLLNRYEKQLKRLLKRANEALDEDNPEASNDEEHDCLQELVDFLKGE